MMYDTNTRSDSSSNATGTGTGSGTSRSGRRQQQHDHLQQLREKIEDTIDYVGDADLKREMREWVANSFNLPSGSIDGHVEHRIAEMESEHRMQNHDGVRRGGEAFPDACQGCPSYGGGCPIVTHPTPQQELERISGEADSPTRYKLEVRRLARDYDCHRLPQFITEFENEYADRIQEGQDLLERTDVDILESATDEPTQRVDISYDDGSQGGGDSGNGSGSGNGGGR